MSTLPVDGIHLDSKPQETFSLEKYIESLSEKEKKAYLIAKSHLGSSFSLVKSLGYLEWKAKQS